MSQDYSRLGDDGIVGLLVMDPCMMGIWTHVSFYHVVYELCTVRGSSSGALTFLID